MINFDNLENYRENNRIEAKKATGGLPQSIWETYSAFANTMGGIILLGVIEDDNKAFRAVNLPEPDKIIEEFWDTINNPNKVNLNILSQKHIGKVAVDGNTIVAITVPRAQRIDKPIYINGNPMSGTYRRDGEGDYKCSKEIVKSMLRDASVETQDMLVLKQMSLDVFNYETIKKYRMRMNNCRPGHVWTELEDNEFLYKLGGIGRDEEGKLHPTVAGLLMFGNEYEIVKEFSAYFLDYQEQLDNATRWTDRMISSSGDWSGNLYDFYFKVYNKLIQNIKVPFKLNGRDRIDDTPIHTAIREALANALINADYYEHGGVIVKNTLQMIQITNPGNFRIDINDAISGGFSDPRNVILMKMFNLINIGERAGSGIPNIFKVWKELSLEPPHICETLNPDRITLTLTMTNASDKKPPIKTADKKPPIKTADKISLIIEYLTDIPSAKNIEISEYIGVSDRRTREILKQMVDAGIVVTSGNKKNRVYMLKR